MPGNRDEGKGQGGSGLPRPCRRHARRRHGGTGAGTENASGQPDLRLDRAVTEKAA